MYSSIILWCLAPKCDILKSGHLEVAYTLMADSLCFLEAPMFNFRPSESESISSFLKSISANNPHQTSTIHASSVSWVFNFMKLISFLKLLFHFITLSKSTLLIVYYVPDSSRCSVYTK